MAESYYTYGKMVFARSCLLQIKFSEQPPEDLRKSNFFNFIVELRAASEPVHVEDAQFVEFLHENENDTRNGIKYRLRLKYGGIEEIKYIFLMLVDAATLEPIRYEGHDDSRKMQRVLLTHEAICTRCSQKKSCGNKSEAPSDPRITQTGGLQFYLKCNQNCLKGAGNPRDMRRFALALSFDDITLNKNCIVALSNKIFVHNNSKHSRKRKRDVDIKPNIQSCEPITVEPILDVIDVTCIYPKVGLVESSFSFNSKRWSRSGVAFRCADMNLAVTSIIYNVAMTVQLPHHLAPGRIFITMCFNDIPVFTFPYDIQDKIYDSSRRLNGFLILCSDDKNSDYKISHGPNDIVVNVMEGLPVQSCCYHSSSFIPGPYNYGPSPNYPYSSASPVSHDGGHYSSEDSSPSYLPQRY